MVFVFLWLTDFTQHNIVSHAWWPSTPEQKSRKKRAQLPEYKNLGRSTPLKSNENSGENHQAFLLKQGLLIIKTVSSRKMAEPSEKREPLDFLMVLRHDPPPSSWRPTASQLQWLWRPAALKPWEGQRMDRFGQHPQPFPRESPLSDLSGSSLKCPIPRAWLGLTHLCGRSPTHKEFGNTLSASVARHHSHPMVSPPAAKKRLTTACTAQWLKQLTRIISLFRSLKPDTSLPGRESRSGQGCIPSRGSRGEPIPWPFPASGGRLAYSPSSPSSEAATLPLFDQPSTSHLPQTFSLSPTPSFKGPCHYVGPFP